MKTYAFIFARGGSKGVPGKNIRNLSGKPLLAYSIDLAKNIEDVEEIFVSTEDQRIASIARQHGADVINRPPTLAQDDTPEWLAWQHAVEWLNKRGKNFDIFLSLPTTSPLRNSKDILSALLSFDSDTDIVVSITKSSRSPWFNMVKKNKDGFLEILMEHKQTIIRRQDSPKIFDLTTVAYVTRPKFIMGVNGIFEGRVKGIEIPEERALDIDTELDFEIAEFLMDKVLKSNKNKANA